MAVFCEGAIFLATPLMSRPHEMKGACDVIFVDPASSLDTGCFALTRSREAMVVSYSAIYRISESLASKDNPPIALRDPLGPSRFSSDAWAFLLRPDVILAN